MGLDNIEAKIVLEGKEGLFFVGLPKRYKVVGSFISKEGIPKKLQDIGIINGSKIAGLTFHPQKLFNLYNHAYSLHDITQIIELAQIYLMAQDDKPKYELGRLITSTKIDPRNFLPYIHITNDKS